MRIVRSSESPDFDPRHHYLVVVTRECLVRRPLSVPIFEITNGRRARHIDCTSSAGRQLLADGSNVMYVGIAGAFRCPPRSIPFVDLLRNILASGATGNLRASIEHHLAELAGSPVGGRTGAAA